MKILEDNSGKLIATTYIALLVGAMTMGLTFVPRASHAATSPVGIVIPLYTYPTDGTWTAVIQAKQAYPNVPFIAVVNPDSGPGSSQDPNFVQGIRGLRAAGIKVLGYVDTAYGADTISSVEANVNRYKTWYGVDGIMFDDMANQVGYEAYYSTLNNYVHSLIPGSLTMGNPGTSVPASFIGTLDVLDVYESGSYPSLSFITYPGYGPNNFSMIAFDVSLSGSFLNSLSGVASWVYVTDASLPNPYDVLPSYFTSEVAALSAMDPASGSTTTTTTSSTTTSTASSPGSTASVTVGSVGLSGNPISGMWTTWNQNGAVLASGYTPMTFSGTVGGKYLLAVANYQSTVFCHWQDGSTNPQRSVSLTGNVALTAYYSTTGSRPATTVRVTVDTKSVTGAQFAGMWLEVTQNGKTVATGYTALTFKATVGASYTISMSNWRNYIFAHWGSGSANPVLTIAPTQPETLTAYYNTGGQF